MSELQDVLEGISHLLIHRGEHVAVVSIVVLIVGWPMRYWITQGTQ